MAKRPPNTPVSSSLQTVMMLPYKYLGMGTVFWILEIVQVDPVSSQMSFKREVGGQRQRRCDNGSRGGKERKMGVW